VSRNKQESGNADDVPQQLRTDESSHEKISKVDHYLLWPRRASQTLKKDMGEEGQVRRIKDGSVATKKPAVRGLPV
jgi:hypothetical protein